MELFCAYYRNLFYVWAFSIVSLFLYINHIYTDIPFVFCTVFCIWLYLHNTEFIVLDCFILALVYQLRPQAAFYIIAISIHYVFSKCGLKKFWKAGLAILTSIITIIIFNSLIVPQFIEIDRAETIPMWSYVYMAFNEEEFGFQDGSHSPDREFDDVKERLQELGIEKTLKIIGKKVFWTWSEGTYQASRYAFGSEPVAALDKFEKETLATKYVLDSSQPIRRLLDSVMRAQYIVLFALTIFMFRKKYSTEYSLFILLFAANMVFYVFWEIKSRYIIPLCPLQVIFVFIMVLRYVKEKEKHRTLV